LERVRTAPTVLLDAAHNPHGMAATVAALQEEFAFRRLVAVVAILADKDATGMLELLEPYRGHRARVIRLLTLGGIQAPRFGPRMRLRRIAAI